MQSYLREFPATSSISRDVQLPEHLYRTGYTHIREVNRKLFGAEVIDKTTAVWGLDDEGESQGVYRPSGYPGVRMCLIMSVQQLISGRSFGMRAATSGTQDIKANS